MCIAAPLSLHAANAPEPCNAPLPACPDYTKTSSWAAKAERIESPVDVFYVYPTIYADASPKNMDIANETLRARAEHLLVAQAGVYSQAANLFAPFYRQASFATLDPTINTFLDPSFRIGADDVSRAFEFYLANLNHDRPFILAGHSQGTLALLDLMRRRFWDPALQQRLVAAYLIGYSITDEDLRTYPWLKAAQKADDTGVIITFNTQAPGATGSPVLSPGALCINPLNWKTDDTPADAKLNTGAVFYHDVTDEIEREVPHYTGAQIDTQTGALVTTPPDVLPVGSFPPGVLHKYDYAFWYRNLQNNVAVRIKAYLTNH
ncbi:DUF3089 domain-containing protein [Desulfovibrio inopinatus]|uniref:DUF3089 domain-containing protein n=1 Tax=Desulfovibrio inopinatus TaxID=102109 RepID=UPI0009FED859|nr:DUF3089 domain-containing protein [Desulfovibrio inopinatus]